MFTDRMMMAGERFNGDASMCCFSFHQRVKIVEGRVVIFIASIFSDTQSVAVACAGWNFLRFSKPSHLHQGCAKLGRQTCGAGCGQDAVRDGLQSEMPEGR